MSRQDVTPWLVSATVVVVASAGLSVVMQGEEEPVVAGSVAVGMSAAGEPLIRSALCKGEQQPTLTVERATNSGKVGTVARFEPKHTMTNSSQFPVESVSTDWTNTAGGFRVAEQPAGELVVRATDTSDGSHINAVRVTATDWLGLETGQWLVTDWTADGPVNKTLSARELTGFACG